MSSLHHLIVSGRVKMQNGDFLGALDCADALLAEDAHSFDALQLRARALLMLGREADAMNTLRRAYQVLHGMLPAAPLPADESADDDFPDEEEPIGEDALETLLALRERRPLDLQLLTLLAELAEDAGRFPLAREAYDALVQRNPGSADAWEGLVHILVHEDLDAALEVIDRALDLHPAHPPLYEFLGFIRYRRYQYRQAVLAYQEAIDHGAAHADNYQSLIECYYALNERDTALELTRELVGREPDDLELRRFAIEVALRCGDYALALAQAHELVRLQPSHAETYAAKARVELSGGEWAAAERTLRLGFHKAIDGAFALFELVDLLIVEEEFEDATRVADLAYQLAPDHPEASAARGKVLREIGSLPEALLAFRAAALLAPQDDTYQTWIGVVLDNMGDYEGAIAQYDHVLDRHPSDVWTLLNRGLSLLALGRPARALADFTRGLEIDPEEAALYFWRACARVELNETDDALHDLTRALDLGEEIPQWLREEPMLDRLRHDPRFLALLSRVGGEDGDV